MFRSLVGGFLVISCAITSGIAQDDDDLEGKTATWDSLWCSLFCVCFACSALVIGTKKKISGSCRRQNMFVCLCSKITRIARLHLLLRLE